GEPASIVAENTTAALSYWPADRSEPVRELTVGGLLREAAAAAPDQVALVAGVPDPAARRRWTYAALLAEAERAARALLGRFRPGERVAVWAPNIPEWVVLEYGAALAGLTLVTVNPAYRAQELAYVLRQSGAAGIFLVPEYRTNPLAATLAQVRPELPALREVVLFPDWADFLAAGAAAARLPDVTPDDTAQLQYTSGTTGFPKGARLSHRGIVNNARYCAQRLGAAPGEVWLNVMPLFHTAGCGLVALGAAHGRGAQVLASFEPGLALELLERERVTIGGGVPTMLIALLEHPDFPRRDLAALRCVLSGGALVPPDLVRRVEAALGVPFSIVFGTTECSPVLTQTRLDDAPVDRAETIGRALPQTEIQIADPVGGAAVPIGALGELCARGYLVMQGYHDLPEATAAAIDPAGWYHTGDLATMDERGYCRVEGRLKELIIRGGENIYPREIEQVLFAHPAVGDAAVVGVPDERYGEQVAAFVRPAPGGAPTEEELCAYCRERLAAYKTPRHWVFVEQFPLTPSGKVQKFRLREQFVRERAQAG
ncbi:MAG TPA: AMP-binding protein, partial [Thermomicrobiales bacterium]|nr:AMP-binding protein [Thermomicrobiales bacterium]